jgi:hypothetical protein
MKKLFALCSSIGEGLNTRFNSTSYSSSGKYVSFDIIDQDHKGVELLQKNKMWSYLIRDCHIIHCAFHSHYDVNREPKVPNSLM